MAWPLTLMVALTIKVAPGLLPAVVVAIGAWMPYLPQVNSVAWCLEDCPWEMQKYRSVGLWEEQTKTIYIREGYTWPPDGLAITMIHEFGHALGLEHSQEPKSIMYVDWTPPVGDRPTAQDYQNVRDAQEIPFD